MARQRERVTTGTAFLLNQSTHSNLNRYKLLPGIRYLTQFLAMRCEILYLRLCSRNLRFTNSKSLYDSRVRSLALLPQPSGLLWMKVRSVPFPYSIYQRVKYTGFLCQLFDEIAMSQS